MLPENIETYKNADSREAVELISPRFRLEPPPWLFKRNPEAREKLRVNISEIDIQVLLSELNTNFFASSLAEQAKIERQNCLIKIFRLIQSAEDAKPLFSVTKEKRVSNCVRAWRQSFPEELCGCLDEQETLNDIRSLIALLDLLPQLAWNLYLYDLDKLGDVPGGISINPEKIIDKFFVDSFPDSKIVEKLHYPETALELIKRKEFIELWNVLLEYPYLAEALVAQPALFKKLSRSKDSDIQLLASLFPEQKEGIVSQADRLSVCNSPDLLVFLLDNLNMFGLLADGKINQVQEEICESLGWSVDHSDRDWLRRLLEELGQQEVIDLLANMGKNFGTAQRDLFESQFGQHQDTDCLRAHFIETHGRPHQNWKDIADKAMQAGVMPEKACPSSLVAAPEHRAAIDRILDLPHGVQVVTDLLTEGSQVDGRRDCYSYIPNHFLRGGLAMRIFRDMAQGGRRKEAFNDDYDIMGRNSSAGLVRAMANTLKMPLGSELTHCGITQYILEKPSIKAMLWQGSKFFVPILEQMPAVSHRLHVLASAGKEEFKKDTFIKMLDKVFASHLTMSIATDWSSKTKHKIENCVAVLVEALINLNEQRQKTENRPADLSESQFEFSVPPWVRSRLWMTSVFGGWILD